MCLRTFIGGASLDAVTNHEDGPVELREHPERGAARVLVVDDQTVIRQLIAVNLELEGFEVFQAEDGQDCLDRIGEIGPDVITLDVKMPRLDGFATAARLRADRATKAVPIVMVTACAQESDLARGRELGVDHYVTKPFDPADLVRAVRSAANLD